MNYSINLAHGIIYVLGTRGQRFLELNYEKVSGGLVTATDYIRERNLRLLPKSPFSPTLFENSTLIRKDKTGLVFTRTSDVYEDYLNELLRDITPVTKNDLEE